MSSIAVVYNWPDFRPSVRTQVKVDRAVPARYAGTYQLAPNFNVTFRLDGDQPTARATGQPEFCFRSRKRNSF